MKKHKGLYHWIWQVCGREKGMLLALTLIQMLLGGASVLGAWLLRGLIDGAVAGEREAFFRYAAFFIALTLGQIALRALQRHWNESCRTRLENRLKTRLFAALLYGNYADVTKVHSGQWLNRLTSDTVVLTEGIIGILPEASGMVVKLGAAVALLVALIPRLGLALLLGGVLLILLTLAFRRRLKGLHRAIQEADGSLRSFLTEQLSASQVLRAFGVQNQALKGAERKMDAHRSARMKRSIFSNLCNIGFGLAINGAYVLGAVFCGYGILTGTLSYGTFTAVLQLVSQIQSPFANLSGFVPRFYAALASAERLQEAEGFPPDLPGTPVDAQALYEKIQAICLENATFTYPGEPQPALENRDLTLKKGSFVAFTGPSGCGKTTVLKLLLALYPLDSGQIFLETEVGRQPLDARHRDLFAYVPQGNLLISGTIREALTFGRQIPEDRLWRALQIACAEGFVKQLDRGLETCLGERGAGLSEGQLQRLSLARALLTDRPILLLDEATSALDGATEAAVLKNIRNMTDKTVVLVTHRPTALAICDQEVPFGKSGTEKRI